jgi:hypothetical protein
MSDCPTASARESHGTSGVLSPGWRVIPACDRRRPPIAPQEPQDNQDRIQDRLACRISSKLWHASTRFTSSRLTTGSQSVGPRDTLEHHVERMVRVRMRHGAVDQLQSGWFPWSRALRADEFLKSLQVLPPVQDTSSWTSNSERERGRGDACCGPL